MSPAAQADPPGPPKRADARRNYDRLLAAAAEAFAEHGADDVSLEEIARRAGVGIGTLYRHFPVRQALIEAVYTDQVDGLDTLAGKLLAAESPAAALTEWVHAMLAFTRTKQSLTAGLAAAAASGSGVASTCRQILWGRSQELLSRAQEAGEARPDIQVADLMRLIHGLIAMPSSASADPEQDERLFSLVIDGLLTPAHQQ